jgi:mannose/fructose/N-acetylgalactosamine-specific phosphotransferase system component IIC
LSLEIIKCALLAGLLSLDLTAVGQFMLCRPLMAGWLCGVLLGDAGAGLALGGIMEMIWIGSLPVGSLILPDLTIGAVFSAAAAILLRHLEPSLAWEACALWGLLVGLVVAWLGGLCEQWQRRWHTSLIQRLEEDLDAGREGFGRAISLSLGASFLRGALLIWLSLTLLLAPMFWLLELLPPYAKEALARSYWLSLVLGFVVMLDHFWERRWLPAAAISFVAGVLGIYVLHFSGASVLGLASLAAVTAAMVEERRFRNQEGSRAS